MKHLVPVSPPGLRESAWMSIGTIFGMFLYPTWPALLFNLFLFFYYLWIDKKKLVIADETGPYLTRYHLIRTPWFRVFLHHIHKADKDRDPHNHPWPRAIAFVLFGGYSEKVTWLDGLVRMTEYRGNFAGSFSRAAFREGRYHRIVNVLPNTWTLFFAGVRSRDWGFLSELEHVPCREYLGLSPDHDFGD